MPATDVFLHINGLRTQLSPEQAAARARRRGRQVPGDEIADRL